MLQNKDDMLLLVSIYSLELPLPLSADLWEILCAWILTSPVATFAVSSKIAQHHTLLV